MKTLFLCTEVAGYFANCIQLYRDQQDATVGVVYFPNSPNAPFRMQLKDMQLINKAEWSRTALISWCDTFSPQLIYVAGWTDRDYLAICRKYKQKGVDVICGLDNAWVGSLRQRLASLLSHWLIQPYFSYFWVAGQRQRQFARRLGMPDDHILRGLYAADVSHFGSISKAPLHHYLVFVGRFESIKGVTLLYEVFNQLSNEDRKGWKLKMIGNGSLKSKIKPTACIEILDFMQPKDLIPGIADAGGFILPSHHEPWGVVVQEFAAAGKPLLLSDRVNSGEAYLIHNFNGYYFKRHNAKSLRDAILSFINLSDEERQTMGHRSRILAKQYEPDHWVAQLAAFKQT